MALPATDAFTNTNGTALATHNASWSVQDGAFDINTNALSPNDADESVAKWTGDTFDDDHYSQGVISAVAGSNTIGVAVRIGTGSNYYLFYGNLSESYFGKFVAGTWTQFGSARSAFAASDEVRLEASSTTITPYINDVAAGSAATDSSLTTGAAGLAGFGDDTNFRLDDWEGGNLGGGGGTSVHDAWTEIAEGGDSFTPEVSAHTPFTEGAEGGDIWTASTLTQEVAVHDTWTEGAELAEGFSTLELFVTDDEGAHGGDLWTADIVTVSGSESVSESLEEIAFGGDSFTATVVSHASWEEGAEGNDLWGSDQLPPLLSNGAPHMHIRTGIGL